MKVVRFLTVAIMCVALGLGTTTSVAGALPLCELEEEYVPGPYDQRWTDLVEYGPPSTGDAWLRMYWASLWLVFHVQIVNIGGVDRHVVSWCDAELHNCTWSNYVEGYLVTDNLWASRALSFFQPSISQLLEDTLIELGYYGNGLHDSLFHCPGVPAWEAPLPHMAPADEPDPRHGTVLGTATGPTGPTGGPVAVPNNASRLFALVGLRDVNAHARLGIRPRAAGSPAADHCTWAGIFCFLQSGAVQLAHVICAALDVRAHPLGRVGACLGGGRGARLSAKAPNSAADGCGAIAAQAGRAVAIAEVDVTRHPGLAGDNGTRPHRAFGI